MLPSISLEDQLILSCLQQQTEIPFSNLNEDYLLHRMCYHRLTSMVYQHLLKTNQLRILSKESQIILKEHYHTNIIRNLAISYLIKKLGKIFQEKIPVMALKGAVMTDIFPDYATIREMRDLDILIKYCDLERAIFILTQSGFDSRYTQFCYNKRKKWYYLNLSNAIPLSHTRQDLPAIAIELHHQLFSCLNNTQWLEENLWQQAIYSSERGLYHPDKIDLLLHLCAHQCNDLQIYLYGFLDVAYLLNTWSNSIDWIEVITRAKARKMLLHLVNVLRLTHELTNIPLPQAYFTYLKCYETHAQSGYFFLIERLFNQELVEDIESTLFLTKAFRRLEYSNLGERFWIEIKSLIPMPIALRLSYYINQIQFRMN